MKLSIIAETAITVPKETVDLAWMSFFWTNFSAELTRKEDIMFEFMQLHAFVIVNNIATNIFVAIYIVHNKNLQHLRALLTKIHALCEAPLLIAPF